MYQDSYKIIGLMSGTSLDGLDICFCEFNKTENQWSFKIIQATTVEYPSELLQRLQNANSLSAIDLYILDQELGNYFAESVNYFLDANEIQPAEVDYISSHGHTIYHQPDKKITVQIGCGTTLAFNTGIKVINDYRKKDVIAGGQGAPLVPIGDALLFGKEADSFLNIGGFANLSFQKNNLIEAFDICPANILINWYMRMLGHDFDFNGTIASSYPIDQQLLDELNNNTIYKESKPHSLGIEWLETEVIPIIDDYDCTIETKIATITEHAAVQISKRLNQFQLKSVYTTGGGTKNAHLIQRIAKYYNGKIIIPTTEIIDFKEAIIFAFLGVLYLENIPNCISTVTGASKDVIGGILHLP